MYGLGINLDRKTGYVAIVMTVVVIMEFVIVWSLKP
jgi:hypothetical protein